MKDCIGREICVGDVIALARRSGSYSWLGLRNVTKVEPQRVAVYPHAKDPGFESQPSYVTCSRNVIIVQRADSLL